jgi:hypothetical protein
MFKARATSRIAVRSDFNAGKFRVDDIEVGPANPAGADLHPNLSVAGDRVFALQHSKRRARSSQHHRMHVVSPNQHRRDRGHLSKRIHAEPGDDLTSIKNLGVDACWNTK